MNRMSASWHDRAVNALRPALRPAIAALPAYVPGARPSPGQHLWKLSSNENPYPPLPSVLTVIGQASGQVNRYPDMYATEAAQALAAHVGVEAEQVVVGNGSVAVLAHILSTFVAGPDDEVVYAWRSFEAYPIAVTVAGGTSVTVPLRDDGSHNLAAMAAAVSQRTKLVIVCTPNNPTGPSVSHDALVAFIESLPASVLVVVDEAYLEFVRGGGAVDGAALVARYPNVVLLRTLSKAYGLAGLRVGYAVGQPDLAAGIRSVSTPFGVNGLAQEAALASLAPTAQAELMARVDALTVERARVVAGLEAQGWRIPETQANFVWLPLGEATMERAAQARQAGILVRPFAGEGIRVTVGEPEANTAFLALAANWL
jgi:histidinol-phosphate aminotransferase